ncbi:unnamed protein product [Phytophthora fragariaefolia]|uniref:Unnamed protein product n=1 Tax=Phytophthora fragariaefolia TaxID=1490495 RepID=A0A9W6XD07_9STRA|nr:unnamed protein product [Phytophthora fragariaefolia]
MRVLNTLQSCDTVALSMELFQSDRKESRFADFLQLMEVISSGGFLSECPEESMLKQRVWGETKVLSAAGSAVLKALGSKTIVHLQDLKPSMPTPKADAAKVVAARSSLEGLMDIMAMLQRRVSHGISVDTYFTSSFEDAITSPQAAVIKLLLAEHLQEQCSLLLCDKLSKEEELSVVSASYVPVEANKSVDNGRKAKSITTNHSQRRRASRKKMIKQRKRDNEFRAAQQTRFSSVLHELCEHFRRKHEEALACVDNVLREVIDTAVGGSQFAPGGWRISPEPNLKGTVLIRQKKKKKKPKKKKHTLADAPLDMEDGISSKLYDVATHYPTRLSSSSTKGHSSRLSDESHSGEHSGATTGSDSSPTRHDQLRLPDCSDSGSTHDDGPRLSFFSNVGSTGTTTSISSASALPLSTFGSQSLYSSTTTPFFLSLAPRDQHSQSRGPRRSIDDDDEENQSSPEQPISAAHEATSTSESSNFEWYLPSVFSLQTSANRTISPSPALDWHFNHWQFKTPESGIDKGAPSSTPTTTGLDLPPPPSSSSSTSSASSRFANARISGSTRKYSLASFSKIAGMEVSKRGSTQTQDHDRHGLTGTSIREHCDGTSSVADSDNESDFLYREGGFFDRQRAIKRRRRPWPFNYAHEDDEDEIVEERDARKDGCPSIYESPKQCFSSSGGKGGMWTECVHCCKCACHSVASLRPGEGEETADNHDEHQCGNTTANLPVKTEMSVDSDALGKITVVMERITQLEEKLAEKSKQAANASSEIASLKQTVSTLTVKLHNVENDLQELHLQQSSGLANTGGLDESSLGNESSCSSSPTPFSPAPSSLDQQVDSPPTAGPPLPETYATTNSVLGPFVSVPLSVLPPRSKLHWDLCEFAAQLQADSDARLPAQLAAQRLCTATVQSLWPRAQVRPYGSHVTRLVLPSSDVDLVICLPKVRRDAPADAAGVLEGRNAIKETWQQNLARKLRQEPWVVRDSVKTLPHAAVPIITLLTAPPYNVRLDISFEGPGHNGLATNDVVLALLHEFPPLAPMMLVLKSFAIERGLAVAYSGGLSSYALLLLVARYLQEHSDTMPNGFANASRAVQHSLSTVQAGVADFGLMLMGFLDFYGNRFDPRTTGISVASRCFLNRESTFMAGLGDMHQVPHQYQQQYAADDAAVDDRTSQYGYAQHWQVPMQPHGQSLSPNAEAASAQGLRRYGYRSSLDLPASRALDGMGAATGLLDYPQLQQQTYDPHKFDPVFIEDPLCPSNNVGRNCFRIMQIRRAFSAAHLALLSASRDPTVFAENRMAQVAGVGLHPDNILRSILGPGAPVNAKPDAAASAAAGVTMYAGDVEHPHAFHPYHHQQQYAYHHHHHQQLPQQSFHHVGIPQSRSVSAYRNDAGSRRHSESESEKLTTRSTTSFSHHDSSRKRHLGSPRLDHGGDNRVDVETRLRRQSSTERGNQPSRQSSLKQIHGERASKALSRKNSERSMSLSLSFADVVRDGGNTYGSGGVIPKTSPLAPARPPRFSRDDMALEESINERWETKDDSDLK